MLTELPIAMLACARIGAVHSVLHNITIPPHHPSSAFPTFFFFFLFSNPTFLSIVCRKISDMFSILQVVFAGFSAESLAQRIMDCKPKVVITCNAVKRGSKVIQLKDIVDAALVEAARNKISVGGKITAFSFKHKII
jgi:acyl-coenzyme A synthetase/AMP-(fatty) acid ligase